MGECGVRGGYAEIVNMDADVMAMLQKSISAKVFLLLFCFSS